MTRKQNENSLKEHIQSLDNITLNFSLDPSSVLVVTDASIKNHVTMSILHTYVHNKQVVKTIYHIINVTTTKAESFTIRYCIN